MRRKRFQHHADTLCHMFCGWQLHADWAALTRLKSGEIRIDALTGTSHVAGVDGAAQAELVMGRVLQSWLAEDCASNAIPIDTITEAMLVVTVTTEETAEQTTSMRFADPTPPHVQCQLRCHSRVVSGDDVYESQYVDHEEWPKSMAR